MNGIDVRPRSRKQRALYCCQCGIVGSSSSSDSSSTSNGKDGGSSEALPSLKRCGRCKVSVYCSRRCQKANFPMHKGLCQRIAKFNDVLAVGDDGVTGTDVDDGTNNALADTVLELAYRSCDTIERGADLLERALDSYHMALAPPATTTMASSKSDDPLRHHAIVAAVFLLTILGYTDEAYRVLRETVEGVESLEKKKMMMMINQGPEAEERVNDDDNPQPTTETTIFTLPDDVDDVVVVHCLLLIKMGSYVTIRRDEKAFRCFQRRTALDGKVRGTVREFVCGPPELRLQEGAAMKAAWQRLHRLGVPYGQTVLEQIPLTPDDLPHIFPHTFPPAFWMILQDFVMFDSGIRKVYEDHVEQQQQQSNSQV